MDLPGSRLVEDSFIDRDADHGRDARIATNDGNKKSKQRIHPTENCETKVIRKPSARLGSTGY
jgi:hypothetical protein